MFEKTLMIATVAGAIAVVPMAAEARSDRANGALVGAGIGALIGSSVNGRDGAVVGGLLGALAGAGFASDRYDHRDYRSYRGSRYDGNGYRGRTYYTPHSAYVPRYSNGYTRAYNDGRYGHRDGRRYW